MKKQPSIHPLCELHGPPRACGRQYGERQAEAIEAFLHMEVLPDAKRRRYAARCWHYLQRWQKPVVDFIRGLAEGSGLSVEELTLLLAHEEIVHTKHCTALGATGPGTKDGRAIIGQNWDWNAPLYPWPSLTRVHSSGSPSAILYSYPGLWAAAGINENGLALVWTGSGYLPMLKPITGIPTYALIPGILNCRDCRGAIDLLRRTRIAGSFIFFIADATGEVWVIEGLPGRLEIVRCHDVISRANHYECANSCRLSHQQIDPPILPGWNTNIRGSRMAELARKYRGKINGAIMEQCLSDEACGPGHRNNLCATPSGPRRNMTIDSFYCVPAKREFWIARGAQNRHEYQRHTL